MRTLGFTASGWGIGNVLSGRLSGVNIRGLTSWILHKSTPPQGELMFVQV